MQYTTQRGSASRPPWSPLSVSLISLLLPAGGAILTIWNMQRLKSIDSSRARELTIASIGVFAVGIVVLLVITSGHPHDAAANQDTAAVLGGGIAVASHLVQKAPYRTWRKANQSTRTSSWLAALGTACVFTLLTVIAALPVLLLFTLVAVLSGQGTGAI